jgi:ribonuclease BN (tRNA processing enzyme)
VQPVRVAFLGTGDAFSAAGSFQASYLIRGADMCVLMDCGASTLTSMKRHRIDAAPVDLVLLSHLHGDHFAGLPYLFLEYIYEQRRQRPLHIAGPPGTEARVRDMFSASYREIASHPLPFPLEFTEMLPEVPAAFGAVGVEPFRVPHQENEISLGLRISIDGRTLLYSGDTGWTEDLVTHSRGAHLFICECCYFETRVWFHLDYPRLAEHRQRFGAKHMLLTHLGREVLARRHEVAIDMARDGLTLDI